MNEFTVLDYMNFLAAHHLPISGFAISALLAGMSPETIFIPTDDEEGKAAYQKVLDWMNKDGGFGLR